MNSEKTASEIADAVIDGSSANAPGYLKGNPRRKEAEKERQELKKKKLEQSDYTPILVKLNLWRRSGQSI